MEVSVPVDVITQEPIYNQNNINIHVWRNLIFDLETSRDYENNHDANTDDHRYHDMVISLLPWHEMEEYDITEYPRLVQQCGKIFIHFPMHKTRSNKESEYVSSFSDMRAVTTMINKYMNGGKRVLIHCHKDRCRILLFMACCMVQNNESLREIKSLMKLLGLGRKYLDYIRDYAVYIIENT